MFVVWWGEIGKKINSKYLTLEHETTTVWNSFYFFPFSPFKNFQTHAPQCVHCAQTVKYCTWKSLFLILWIVLAQYVYLLLRCSKTLIVFVLIFNHFQLFSCCALLNLRKKLGSKFIHIVVVVAAAAGMANMTWKYCLVCHKHKMTGSSHTFRFDIYRCYSYITILHLYFHPFFRPNLNELVWNANLCIKKQKCKQSNEHNKNETYTQIRWSSKAPTYRKRKENDDHPQSSKKASPQWVNSKINYNCAKWLEQSKEKKTIERKKCLNWNDEKKKEKKTHYFTAVNNK